MNSLLQRINKMYPKEQLTDYYIILTNLHLFFSDKNTENTIYLKDSENRLKKLNEKPFDDLSKSELLTLEGYVYMAKISSNPMEFGASLSPKTARLFSSAIALDSNNPRPRILQELLFIGKKQFFKEDISDNCRNIKTIEPLLIEEKKGIYYPNWGKEELQNLKKICNL